MVDITKDIQPLTTFRNNSVKMMRQLKRTKRPVILTVNGKVEAVVQDAAAYQKLLDVAAKARMRERESGKDWKMSRSGGRVRRARFWRNSG